VESKRWLCYMGGRNRKAQKKHENVGFSLVFKAIMALCDS
jgi:hypothetical protein